MTSSFLQWVKSRSRLKLIAVLSLFLFSPMLFAHGVSEGDKG